MLLYNMYLRSKACYCEGNPRESTDCALRFAFASCREVRLHSFSKLHVKSGFSNQPLLGRDGTWSLRK